MLRSVVNKLSFDAVGRADPSEDAWWLRRTRGDPILRDWTHIFAERRDQHLSLTSGVSLFGPSEDTQTPKTSSANEPVPYWLDLKRHVDKLISELTDTLLPELEQAHTSQLSAHFDRNSSNRHAEERIEELSQTISAKLRDAQNSVKRIWPGNKGSVKSEPEVAIIQRNVQCKLSLDLSGFATRYKRLQERFLKQEMRMQKNTKDCVLTFEDGTPMNWESEEELDDGMLASLATEEALMDDRNAQCKELATQVREVASLMSDLETMVFEQGSIIDRIDYQWTQIQETTKEGVSQLLEAEKHAQSNFSLKVVAVLVVIVTVEVCMYIVKKTKF